MRTMRRMSEPSVSPRALKRQRVVREKTDPQVVLPLLALGGNEALNAYWREEIQRNGFENARSVHEALTKLPTWRCDGEMMKEAMTQGDTVFVHWHLTHCAANDPVWLLPLAAACGRVDVLKRVWTSSVDADVAKSVVTTALNEGSMDVAQWLYQTVDDAYRRRMVDEAARYGRLDVLRWLHTTQVDGWLTQTMDLAAEFGHLDIVQWLHVHRSEGCTTRAMDRAAMRGHLDMVEWLHGNREEGCTTYAMDCAAINGDLEMLNWFHVNRSEGCSTFAMDCAARNGRLDVVAWLLSHRNEGCSTRAMDWAAESGHLEVLKRLDKYSSVGCTTDAMDLAAVHGHLHIVKWLHENRSEGCTENAVDHAARHGHREVVEWLMENRLEGCTANSIIWASARGHFAVVRSLYLNGVRTPDAVDEAATHGHWGIVEWLLENQSEWGTIHTLTAAIESREIDITKTLYDRRELHSWPRLAHTNTLVKLSQGSDPRDLAILRHITERRRDRYLPIGANNPVYPAEEEDSGDDSDRTVESTEPFVLTAVSKVATEWNLPEETTAHLSGFIVCDPTTLCRPTIGAQRGWVHWLLRFAHLRPDHMRLVAESGNLHGACQLHDALAKLGGSNCSKRFMYRLMEEGDLDLAKWHIRECNAHLLDEYLYAAVWIGRVDLVEWIHENWSDLSTAYQLETSGQAATTTKTMFNSLMASFSTVQQRFASELMEIETLMSRFKQGNVHPPLLPLSTGDQYFDAADRNRIQTNLLDLAAVKGSLKIVTQLTRFRKGQCTVSGLVGAVIRGHVSVVRQLYASQPELASWPSQDDALVMLRFLLNQGNREMLEFFRRERSMRLEIRDLNQAVALTDEARVQLICELNLVESASEAIEIAAVEGKYDVLKILCESYPATTCSSTAMDGAAEEGHLQIVQYLTERNAPSSRRAMDFAARNGHVDIVRYLGSHRQEGCSPYALLWASACGHTDVVQYLLNSRLVSGGIDTCVAVAEHHGHNGVVAILKAYQATRHLSRSLQCSSRHLVRTHQLDLTQLPTSSSRVIYNELVEKNLVRPQEVYRVLPLDQMGVDGILEQPEQLDSDGIFQWMHEQPVSLGEEQTLQVIDDDVDFDVETILQLLDMLE
ncbi:hypothetical protein Poli38472_008074 [Pythium oligandrum]|uniref:Ankyrin repeat protein n=1 Tax=Pythium oligandrum TaxID=41045 RepID=A0A8K1FN26_PYTOL|nr:hypothetical protein Poli38472_008074 [Pythium oligandrum]|eukprot:TMW65432.1 hypothetical protein Poli38472_008074 [Pythium oligandrum]